MISTLHIKNIGIIDDLEINFNEGFNVLTGETGAGKTLIVNSLNNITGARVSKDIIRKNQKSCLVELSMHLPSNKKAIEGNIVVSREVFRNGKNICKINGSLVSVLELKSLMKDVLDIHGQKDNYTLLEEEYHINYLDKYIGSNIKSVKKEYLELYNKYMQINMELAKNYGDDKEKQRKLDLLDYQIKEIKNANLKLGEEEILESKHNVMKNSEKLKLNLKTIEENLDNKVMDGLSSSISAIEKIVGCSDEYEKHLNSMRSMYYELQELSRDFNIKFSEVCFDDSQIDDVENRINDIYNLKRKYGTNITEILEYLEKIEAEVDHINNLDKINEELKKQKEELSKQMKDVCIQLTKIRNEYGEKLSNKINTQLKHLEMSSCVFRIGNQESTRFTKNGLDVIKFEVSTNKGEDHKQLSKIASGGELSRIMLAIKTVTSSMDDNKTLIFDEIDTGISGKAANAVGNKMKTIAKKHQILCITHLPQIAAKGDYNYYISKKEEDDNTKTSIKLLNEEETIQEIARIQNGDITKEALQNAISMRKVG